MWRTWFKIFGAKVVAVRYYHQDEVYIRFAKNASGDNMYCKDYVGETYVLLRKSAYNERWWYL
jgi:hypothetical protein